MIFKVTFRSKIGKLIPDFHHRLTTVAVVCSHSTSQGSLSSSCCWLWLLAVLLEVICENKPSLVFPFLFKDLDNSDTFLAFLSSPFFNEKISWLYSFFFSVYCQLMATLLGICSEMMSHLGVLTPGFTVTMVEHIEVLHYTELLNNSFWKHK